MGGLAQKRIRENGESLNKKKRPKKSKAQDIPTPSRTYVQNKKRVNTATTPQESADHMEKLLTERVDHAEEGGGETISIYSFKSGSFHCF